MVKGLAKLWNRLRHGRKAKYVDAGTFIAMKAGYSPMTGGILKDRGDSFQYRLTIGRRLA